MLWNKLREWSLWQFALLFFATMGMLLGIIGIVLLNQPPESAPTHAAPTDMLPTRPPLPPQFCRPVMCMWKMRMLI